ncbi:MAG TPA: hypothetical protein VEC96_02605 [Anaerolineae bacterium]|nr:hypothetical protein [Anaerolineae bacterium]
MTVWSFVTGYALFYLLKIGMGLRVSREEEIKGLDITEHGMAAYPDEAYEVGMVGAAAR